jgi:flagellar FliJ protein
MKKFSFKLQKLLELRAARAREVHNALAALLGIQNRERMKQEEYRRRIEREQEKFTATLKEGRFTYMESVMFERFVDFAGKVIISAQERIDGMEEEIGRVRTRLVEASRERKVVERLRERRYEEYLYELNREIAKENDDVNQKIYIRKQIHQAGGDNA